jgi:hypothetical protein
MPFVIKVMKPLFPVGLLLAAFGLLAATGGWLHWTPRFGGLSWGLTELAHVWLGWACLIAVVGYLVPHLVRHRDLHAPPQRLLGWLMAVAAVVVLGTGAVLGIGVVGGPPGWLRSLHFHGTWALLGLTLVHVPISWIHERARRTAQGSDPGS